MEREEVCKTLPDELVERIVSMVPFPSIFKARCLSKTWLARLSSIPREEGDAKNIATSFQKLVIERSTNWKTFCPVFISVEGAIIPYDQATQTWQRMPSLSFLPQNVLNKLKLQMEGALVLASAMMSNEPDGEIYVANIVNRTWRRLPPFPDTTNCKMHCSKLLLIDKSLGAYKVILFCEEHWDQGFYFVQIYDSRSDSWISNSFREKDTFKPLFHINFAYFNEFVYIVGGYDPPKLYAFDVEDANVQELELSFNDDFDPTYCHLSFLLVCKADLLMVIGRTDDRLHFQVLKIDLESLTLVYLAEGPPETFEVEVIFFLPITDGNCIFFIAGDFDDRLLKYEIENDTWSWLPFRTSSAADWVFPCWSLASFSFQPGLGPFATV